MLTNLFAEYPRAVDQAERETFEDLLRRPFLRIERIISTGQASPPGFWYCQPHGEWVVVLKGSASLLFENEPTARVLHPGDFVDIPAHCRHRVEWTDPGTPTVWLAVHYGASGEDVAG
ncbi:cupin domain-containing protein [Burkholderia sp. Ac-20353]|uniref:cupin domain-containing protein n=1 Tax=Burkholderia sp. Ac-20353 TaxID=2703894 RepID=UPI00197BD9B0|nr:cupin domain-containing protein [Burkholderia sp. Ac-20353]MBN3785770.1 cupin domain-containing protein [Burkholderia sp. Ac-20353]